MFIKPIIYNENYIMIMIEIFILSFPYCLIQTAGWTMTDVLHYFVCNCKPEIKLKFFFSICTKVKEIYKVFLTTQNTPDCTILHR